jgi:Phosphotransferase enzyme family
MTWIKSYASPRMNYYRSSQDHELPNDGISLLAQYLDVAPYLVPSQTDEAALSNVLWHPDLHLDNVFVDPNTCKITCIIDWQSACVAPLFYQSEVPRMFRHHLPVREGRIIPERPEIFDSFSQGEQKNIDDDLEGEIIHKYYQAQVYKRAPRHWAVLQQTMTPFIRKPVWLVSGVWEHRALFFLRKSLIWLAAHWDEIHPDDQPFCPIKFTKEELELYSREEENVDGVGHMLSLFRDQGILPVDGKIDPEDYDIASGNCRKFKEIFVGLAQDEAERELFTKVWPYQESEK